MEPSLGIALLWLLFGGLHVGLATRRVRAALVARLGEWGFISLFSLLAAVTYTALVHYYALHRLAGGPGLALGATPWLRGALLALVVAGVTLALGSLFTYPASPYALGNEQTRTPRGLERITRHPFFAGVALTAAAHTLLATRLVGTVWLAGLGLLAVLGAWHQDRKLLALRGEPYAAFLAQTSFLPFAAIVAGRQRLVPGELPWLGLAVAAALALGLRAVHDGIFAHGGAWVIGVTVGGAAFLGLQSWRAARRRRRRAADGRAAAALG